MIYRIDDIIWGIIGVLTGNIIGCVIVVIMINLQIRKMKRERGL